VVQVQIGTGWVPGRIERENEKTVIVEVFQKHRETEKPSFFIKVKRNKIREK